MKKIFALATLFFFFVSCEKNPLWVGNSEFVTYEYKNISGIPTLSSQPIDQSDFIEVGNAIAVNLGNGTVEITIEGMRVQTERRNFEMKGYEIFENDGSGFEPQDLEFQGTDDFDQTSIASVLVLDMSTSLGDLVNDLKSYAKNYIDFVVESNPDSKVAVVFFSGRNAIESTSFYSSASVSELKAKVDDFDNYQERTALFEATKTAIGILDTLGFEGTKSIVVFTDGNDNDTNNKTQVEDFVASADYYKIAIGLESENLDKEELRSIASSPRNRIIAKDEKDLEKIFEDVALQIVSVYTLIYKRSDQLVSEPIEIKFEIEVDKI